MCAKAFRLTPRRRRSRRIMPRLAGSGAGGRACAAMPPRLRVRAATAPIRAVTSPAADLPMPQSPCLGLARPVTSAAAARTQATRFTQRQRPPPSLRRASSGRRPVPLTADRHNRAAWKKCLRRRPGNPLPMMAPLEAAQSRMCPRKTAGTKRWRSTKARLVTEGHRRLRAGEALVARGTCYRAGQDTSPPWRPLPMRMRIQWPPRSTDTPPGMCRAAMRMRSPRCASLPDWVKTIKASSP
mmetsp:Transcript_20507/g.51654  ORF Transcript_20507/g.51654 Transcript_20507/m.51654 type:complete len:241 (+) Transcript_20507:989-1711(+)